MKKIFLLSFVLLSYYSVSFAQIYGGKAFINFDKILHIVLERPVDIVKTGSNYISAEIVQEKPNIVRVIAMEEDFQGETNVTIIDKSGRIYTYQIQYAQEMKDKSSAFYPNNKKEEIKNDYKVILNAQNSAFAVFPNDIVYYRSGNENINSEITANNIIMISTTAEDFFESNLFCVDKIGQEYNIILNNGNAANYVYNIGNFQESAPSASVSVNTDNLIDKIDKILSKPKSFYNLGSNKNQITFSIENIYISDKYLFFIIKIQNRSNINYDISFTKYFLVDKKTSKNSVQQESNIDAIPIDEKYNIKVIAGKSSEKIPIVFNKFTIPDDKYFRIEIFEKNGGRNIFYNIDNKNIIKAVEIE